MMKRTKIVATIGPASEKETTLELLFRAGLDVCRLNFSHGEYLWHKNVIARIRRVASRLKKPVAVMADIQGPRIRVANRQSFKVRKGERIFVAGKKYAHLHERKKELVLDCNEFYQYLKIGSRIFIEDGLIVLQVIKKERLGCLVEVLEEGEIKPQKGVNIPDASTHLGFLTPKDWADLDFILEQKVDLIAVSFVANGRQLTHLRNIIQQKIQRREVADKLRLKNSQQSLEKYQPWLIAKIERREAVRNLEGILEEADGIMVARGDLAIEMEQEKVALLQKEIIEKCLKKKKPVIVATQMMFTMEFNARPTRAEISDVTNAVIDGTDAVMFSGETAQGVFPLKVIETATKIIETTEKSPYNDRLLKGLGRFVKMIFSARRDRRKGRKRIIKVKNMQELLELSALRQKDIKLKLTDFSFEDKKKASLVWGAE